MNEARSSWMFHVRLQEMHYQYRDVLANCTLADMSRETEKMIHGVYFIQTRMRLYLEITKIEPRKNRIFFTKEIFYVGMFAQFFLLRLNKKYDSDERQASWNFPFPLMNSDYPN